MPTVSIRPAQKSDAATILSFIQELAVYEKEPDAVKSSVTDIERALFSERASVYGLIAEHQGKAVGFAVYFLNYSTWLGKHGLYLEDLYVKENQRGQGVGMALMKHLAKTALESGYGRFEWSCLDWNTPSRNFYESFGAVAQTEWVGYRLQGKALVDFASKA